MNKFIFFFRPLVVGILSVAFLSPVHANERNLTVETLLPGNGGLMVKFDRKPTACEGVNQTAHAFLPQSNRKFTDFYSKLSESRNFEEKITVDFVNGAACINDATLPVIESVI